MITVGIFARPPRPGLVKTRLIPDIGEQKAASVYRYCLQHALDITARSGLDYRVFLSERSDDEQFDDEQISLQHGPDLGARMFHAFRELLAESENGAIIIGSDCLDLTRRHLLLAAQALADHELVLAPAEDGGYALIGCRGAHPGLFDRVTWSSDRVLRQTLKNARRLDYRVSLLDTVRDIDTLQDLEHYPELVGLIASS